MNKPLASLFLLIAPLLASAETQYLTLNYPEAGSTFLTGIRSDNEGAVYMTGVFTPEGQSDTDGLLYHGPLDGGGTWSVLNFPSSQDTTVTSTALYGPNTLENGDVRIAGSYKTVASGEYDLGLFYEGPNDGSGTWTTLVPPVDAEEIVLFTIAHSTHGNLLVGNFDTDLKTGRAFIYDIDAETYTELVKPGAVSITAYGVWHNGGSDYTIAGGYSTIIGDEGVDQAYLVDYNAETHTASNWREYVYGNAEHGVLTTHFDGITGDGHGGYTLTGDWIGEGETEGLGFFAAVPRETEGGFGPAAWWPINYPSSEGVDVLVTSGNSVYEYSVIGIYTVSGSTLTNGYVATIPQPYLVQGAIPLGSDWYASWMGVIYVSDWPWVYQTELGWFYAGEEGNTNESSWFYYDNAVLATWLWSSITSHGWFYGQPVDTAEPGWWYYDFQQHPANGHFYFYSADGTLVIVGDTP